jgi:hypothetical protein
MGLSMAWHYIIGLNGSERKHITSEKTAFQAMAPLLIPQHVVLTYNQDSI